MRSVLLSLVLLAATQAQPALAHKENLMLQFTMKAIAADLELVKKPTKAATGGDVTDGTILTGIARARTSAFALQLVIDRRDKEMLPGGVDELPPAKMAEKLKVYVDYLVEAKRRMEKAEELLKVEYDKKVAEQRDFGALKAHIADLETLVAESHKVFRP